MNWLPWQAVSICVKDLEGCLPVVVKREYVEFLKGTPLKDTEDLFSGINTTWNRLKNGGEIGEVLYEVEAKFQF